MRGILKDRKLCLMIFALVCFIVIGICTIINFTINNKITWGIYLMLAIPITYIFFIVFLFGGRGGWRTKNKTISKYLPFILPSAILVILGFLDKVVLMISGFVDYAIPIENWFYSLAIPLIISSGIAIWSIYLIIHSCKINVWYKVSSIIFICGVLVIPITIICINKNIFLYNIYNFVNIFLCVVVSAICGIYGYIITVDLPAEESTVPKKVTTKEFKRKYGYEIYYYNIDEQDAIKKDFIDVLENSLMTIEDYFESSEYSIRETYRTYIKNDNAKKYTYSKYNTPYSVIVYKKNLYIGSPTMQFEDVI